MKAPATASVLLIVLARSSLASGVDLAWNDCVASPSALSNRTFACNTNTATFILVGSFVAPSSVLAASGIVSTLYMRSESVSWPAWWGMAPGLCRAGSLTASFDFSGNFDCIDYWQGGAVGAVVMDFPSGNRTRLTVTAGLPAGSPLPSIPEGDEVYAFKILLNAAKTTGLGSCAGCQVWMSICLSSITVTQPAGTPGGDRYIGVPAVRNYVTWQGGLDLPCDPTPVRNTTWGSIKASYR